MPIVVRDGVQYQLEGPNDVPSSGNRIGPVPGIPPVGGFGQSAPFASTGTRRVDLPGGGYTLVPQSTYGDPSLYENSISKTAAAPSPIPSYRLEGPNDVPSSGNRIGPVPGIPVGGFGQGAPGPMGAPNLGSWAPTRPEYLTAPGYETYAPTRAYGYSPTGGDWSGGSGGGGGGGGGGLTSGDFGGGGDNSTLGNALSALSLLGGANSLSSFLTGKSLLEHAGISNPFSGLLDGGGGLNLEALNPYSNTPLTALFGEGGRNLGLASSAFPNALPGGVGGSVGIGPSGYLSPDALAGVSNAASPGSPSLLPGSTYGNAAPLTPIDVQTLPNNLNVPDPFNLGTGEYASNAYLSPSFEAPVAQPNIIAGEPATGGFLTAGQALNQAAMASLFPGAVSTSALAAAPGFSALIPSMGGATAGALGPAAGAAGAGAGGLAGLGAAFPLGVAGAAFGLMQAMRAADPFDPTAETRSLNKHEDIMQGGGAGIAGLEQLVYNEPYKTLDLIKAVTSGGGGAEPFGTPHTSGGTKLISWSPNVSKKVQENMHLLEAARAAGQAAEPSGPDDPYKPEQYVPARLYEPPPVFDYSSDPHGGPPPSGRVLTGDEYYELHGGI